jgi:hypothetical protein
MDPNTGLNILEKGNISWSSRELNHDCLDFQPAAVTTPNTLSPIL